MPTPAGCGLFVAELALGGAKTGLRRKKLRSLPLSRTMAIALGTGKAARDNESSAVH